MGKSTKTFKARNSLLHILRKVLDDKKIKYAVIDCGGVTMIETDISGMEYHRCVEDALCIEQQGSSAIPVLPYRIIADPNTKLPEEYSVLKKDEKRVENLLWPSGKMNYSFNNNR